MDKLQDKRNELIKYNLESSGLLSAHSKIEEFNSLLKCGIYHQDRQLIPTFSVIISSLRVTHIHNNSSCITCLLISEGKYSKKKKNLSIHMSF